MIWFTSDLHIGHEGVIRYCKRPFANTAEMNAALVANWNACVQTTDTVYVLGDMALCHYDVFKDVVSRLKGHIILIKGNHDSFRPGQYTRLGITVYEELKIKLLGKTLRLSHYPYAVPWYKRLWAHKSTLRYMDRRPPRMEGEFLLHGHTHMKYKKRDHMIHVGVDAWDYKPLSLRQLESLLGG